MYRDFAKALRLGEKTMEKTEAEREMEKTEAEREQYENELERWHRAEWEELKRWRESLPEDDRRDFDGLDPMTKRHMVCGLYADFKRGQARKTDVDSFVAMLREVNPSQPFDAEAEAKIIEALNSILHRSETRGQAATDRR